MGPGERVVPVRRRPRPFGPDVSRDREGARSGTRTTSGRRRGRAAAARSPNLTRRRPSTTTRRTSACPRRASTLGCFVATPYARALRRSTTRAPARDSAATPTRRLNTCTPTARRPYRSSASADDRAGAVIVGSGPGPRAVRTMGRLRGERLRDFVEGSSSAGKRPPADRQTRRENACANRREVALEGPLLTDDEIGLLPPQRRPRACASSDGLSESPSS
jgi:hypothetical protein